MLSNGGMTLALQGQGHSILITKVENMTYFGETTGPHSLSIHHYSIGQILIGIFQKLNFGAYMLQWSTGFGITLHLNI